MESELPNLKEFPFGRPSPSSTSFCWTKEQKFDLSCILFICWSCVTMTKLMTTAMVMIKMMTQLMKMAIIMIKTMLNLLAEAVWDWMRGDLVTVWGIAPWFLVRHRLTCFSIKMSEYSPLPLLQVTCFTRRRETRGVFLVFMRMSCHLSRGSAPGRSPSTHGWRRRSLRSGSRSDSCGLGGRSPSVDKSSNRLTLDAAVSKLRLYEYFPFWIPLKNKQGFCFGWKALRNIS